eukprot:3938046-Rhodomonas_salina.1
MRVCAAIPTPPSADCNCHAEDGAPHELPLDVVIHAASALVAKPLPPTATCVSVRARSSVGCMVLTNGFRRGHAEAPTGDRYELPPAVRVQALTPVEANPTTPLTPFLKSANPLALIACP